MKPLSQKAHAAAFHAEFFGNTTQRRYVLGINQLADAVDSRIRLDGFIDEYTSATEYKGKPVLKPGDIPPGSMVISTVTQARARTAMNKLQALKGVVSMDYFSVADASHFQLPQVQALTDTQQEYAVHPEKFDWVRELLADQESREVFNRIMEFRLNANLRALRFFDYSNEAPYAEPFLKFSPGSVVVQASGEAGQAAGALVQHCPQYGKLHLFASGNGQNVTRQQLAGQRNTQVHPFDHALTLDSILTESIDFARLDLEGEELLALEGMKWHIQEDHPTLAVAVYHNPAHFWQVPEFILGLRGDYRVYLRHYSEGWTQTVMFFAPR